ncbi:MAG: carboxypeptidase regulatory-like domain-containing protein, partial [Nitrospira sp.]|nr:carboxypeptidase regulatory-like domain-containing protein [Nitrospira sp.]
MTSTWTIKCVGALILCLVVGIPVAAVAYDVIDVQHGGTVEGTVTLTGAVPEPKGFNLITFPD